MVTRALTISSADGTLDATLHSPGGEGPFPTVILFTDIRGVRTAYAALADTIAAQGYAVVLPNLFYRDGRAPLIDPASPFDDAARARAQAYRARLTVEALGRDFDALLAGLAQAPEADLARIGVVGYCFSGALALRFAAAFPDQVLAAASFHGGHLAVADHADSPHLLAPRIKASVYIGHADQDASAPPEQITRLDGALAASGVAFTTEFYKGACHGWTVDGAAYDAKASARHLRRVLQLLDEALGAEVGNRP